uniref:PTC1-like winged helix-turn-helix domain-containing protein n=1 Tax=Kalanchoe fedtschenkoi TaxID=63787 RepID=A0A7N0RDM0_KALFE
MEPQRETDEDAVKVKLSSRHRLTAESLSDDEETEIGHVIVGAYYEIDHAKLPPTSPVQLQFVKVVMVSGNNDRGVAVRYPSTYSLKSHFEGASGGNGLLRSSGSTTATVMMKKVARMNPALDEKYLMGRRVAAVALFRRIKPDDFVERRGSLSFWAAGPSGSEARRSSAGSTALVARSGGSELRVYQRSARSSKIGGCLSALQSGKVIHWGKRHKVRYVSNEDYGSAGDDPSNPRVITPPNEDKSVVVIEQLINGKEQSGDESSGEERNEGEEEAVKEEHEDEDEDEGSGSEEVNPGPPLRRNRKRKCKVVSQNQLIRQPKKQKMELIVRRKMGLARGNKSRGHKYSIHRWSADRYKLAETNMLKIMKEKGAVFENPMMRQKLRDEARKVIGDTGLLDHLLKHMSGKVAPGGAERFRRRHNAEGAMEYWLESADLVEIRKMAGVSDPFWMPPPGWKLGDNPSQHPSCAMEIKQLREEVDKLKKKLNELLQTKGQPTEDTVATTPLSCVSEENLITDIGVHPLKEELVKRRFRLEKQMLKLSHYLTEMEEEVDRLSKVEKLTKAGSDGAAGAGCPTLGTEKMDAEAEVMAKTGIETEVGGQTKENTGSEEAALSKAKEKAAMIERLKSGFRICKPEGSFKWPNMAAAASPIPDSSISSSSPTPPDFILAAQTPPSVSSATTKPPSLPLTQPVKPLATRHAAAFLVSATPALHNQATRIPTKFPALIDLNYTPAANPVDCIGFYGACTSSYYTHWLSQRDHQSLAMISGGSASHSSHHVQVNKKPKTMARMSPRLEAEANRLVAFADQEQYKRPSSANTSPTSLAAAVMNTWVPVPAPGHWQHKSNQ